MLIYQDNVIRSDSLPLGNILMISEGRSGSDNVFMLSNGLYSYYLLPAVQWLIPPFSSL